MRYAEHTPAPELRPFVDRYWSLEDRAPSAEPHLVLPDGHPEWVAHTEMPFTGQSGCLYIGQMTAPVQLRAAGPVSVFGVRFRPEGAWAFSGVPQDRFRDSICDLSAVVPGAREWRERVGNGDAVVATDRFLLSVLRLSENIRVTGVVDQLMSGHGIAATACDCGWSVRQLERVIVERTGLSPKTLARLGRFHRALRLRSASGAWAGIAAECGYTDQSHLIRDFRQFAGSAPSLLQATEMTAAMLR